MPKLHPLFVFDIIVAYGISMGKFKHGMSETRIYRIWAGIKTRCNNPNEPAYQQYGGRGIKICKRWESFKNFYADMGEPPSRSHSIDRINNDRGYFPSNCRWATRTEQCNNRRTNHIIQIGDDRKTIAEWSRISGIPQRHIVARLKYGYSEKDAVFSPVKKPHKICYNGESMNLKQWAKHLNTSYNKLYWRKQKYGDDLERVFRGYF